MRGAYGVYDVAVLGLGFAGSFTTETLCRENVGKVVAVDANPYPLGPTSSSRNECFKLHTGVHYIGDLETAKKCLKNSVVMADKYHDFILDADNPMAPSRRGRHYIMSNSQFTVERAQYICESLKEYYAELLLEYPDAAYSFGDPENFITYLSKSDYDYITDEIPCQDVAGNEEMAHVMLGIETPECQIDIEKFSSYFATSFESHDDLATRYNTRVNYILKLDDENGYIVEIEEIDSETGEGTLDYIFARCIVNCTWQNVEVLDKQLGFYEKDDRINRLKVLARVELPEALKDMNTCIFSVGPHASITRYRAEDGSEQAILTYEPVTNAGFFEAGATIDEIENEEVRRLMSEPLTPESDLGQYYGERIIEGVARYVPAFKGAKIRSMGLGFVKNFFSLNQNEGNAYLFSPNSPHHMRLEEGVEQKGLGYISFSGMKMTYTCQIASQVVQIARKNLATQAAMKVMAISITPPSLASDESSLL